MKDDPEFVNTQLPWILVSLNADDTQKAKEMLNQAIELNPENILARTRLGTILFNEGDFAQAQLKWLQALKMAPQTADLFYCIGLHTMFVKKDVKKAQSCFEKALMYKPSFSEAFYALCVILCQNGQIAKAVQLITDFERDHDRTLPFTYLLKGLYDFETKNYVQAIENL